MQHIDAGALIGTDQASAHPCKAAPPPWFAALMISWVMACASGQAPPLVPLRMQLNQAIEHRDAAAVYRLTIAVLCENPQAADAPERIQKIIELWDSAGRVSAWETDVPCALSPALSHFAAAMVASAQASWPAAAAALAEAQASAPMPWQADIALRQALVARHTGQSRLALQYIERALAAAPNRVDVHLFAAQTRLGQGEPAFAVDALRPIVKLHPSPVELGRARALLQDAVILAEPPLSHADDAAVTELLETLQQDDPLDSAELEHARLLAQTAPHPRVLILAALVCLRLGQQPEGLTLLDTAALQSPLNPDPARILGGHHMSRHESQAALTALQKAWRLDPFDVEIGSLMAQTACDLGELRTACEAYRSLTHLAPNVPAYIKGLRDVQHYLEVPTDGDACVATKP